MLQRPFLAYVLAIFATLALAGCSATGDGPVKSEISTYDSTFTASVSTNERLEKDHTNPLRFADGKRDAVMQLSQGEAKRPYFVEFRARSALSYGHASVVFGKLRNGKIPVDSKGVLDPKLVQISGLHPATNDPAQWARGHVAPVPAETGPSDGDFEDAYVTARYQVNLTEAEFRQFVRIVNKHKQSYPYWYAPNYATNCLGYIGSIAKDMGLNVPVIPSMPKKFVEHMKKLNT